MKKIGLTGGIGSGKSTVAEIFHCLGIPVFDSDKVARKLQDENPEVKKAILETFNSEAPGEIYMDGKLNRKKVSEIVFKDKNKLEKLNAIVHPAVAKAFERFCEANRNSKCVIKEAALLYEIGEDKFVDGMIVVAAPDELRIKRVINRDNVSPEDVLRRIKNQMPQEEKIQRADFVIVNDGKEMLVPQVIAIHAKLITRKK
ncbi:MAG: dephospho-CoA kinase [Bacteroidetes bacterium]|jgi:dephospho-CoA kinase|nr:dephospho-CoA kinase [Bacteroidota bacterium]